MRTLGTLCGLTLRRLLGHPLRALLSVGGVALAVALTFAVQIAGSTTDGAGSALRDAFRDDVRLEVVGRTGRDLPRRAPEIVDRRALGVAGAGAVLDRAVTLHVGKRVEPVYLIGLSEGVRQLLTPAARRQVRRASRTGGSGLYLPPTIAERLAVRHNDSVDVGYAGRATELSVARAVRLPGIADDSPLALAPIQLVEKVARVERASRILLAVASDDRSRVERVLERRLGPGVEVRTTDTRAALLAQASALDRRGAALFGAVAILLGCLLAYVALHLSIAERRREIATLRLAGVPDAPLVLALAWEALTVAAIGCVLGLVVGDLVLSELVAREPSFLEQAFLLTERPAVEPSMVAVSVAVGVFAVVAASVVPARMVLAASPIEALDERAPGRRPTRLASRHAVVAAFAGGVAATVAGALLALNSDRLGIAGIVLFFGGVATVVACATPAAVAALGRVASVLPPAAELAIAQLRATPQRTAPLVAGIALAVATVLSVNGTAENIEDGASALAAGSFPSGQLWLSADRPHNDLLTVRLAPATLADVRGVPGVRSASGFRSTFLDWAGRRTRAFAYDRPRQLNERAVLAGDLAAIERQLASGVGAVLSPELARALDVEIGERFAVPSPTGPRGYRLAGLVTNYGWAPGVLGLSSSEYVSSFGRDTVTAIRVDPEPGASPRAALAALAAREGLRIETTAGAESRATAAARQGLAQMRRIATIFLIVTVVAVVGLMLTAVVQRMPLLAALGVLGLSPAQLRRSLYAEACVALGLGVAGGICAGLVAQALMVDVLGRGAGYPVLAGFAPLPVALALASGLLSAVAAGTVAALVARQAAPRAAVYE